MPDSYLQIIKLIIGLGAAALAINGLYNWKKGSTLYLASTGLMALAILWSFVSAQLFTGVPRSINSFFIITVELTAFAMFVYAQFWKKNRTTEHLLSNQELINQFSESAIKHARYVESKDRELVAKSNDAVEKMKGAYFELKNRDPHLSILRPLLENDSASVRMWTARRLLDKYENQSLAALDDLAKGTGYVSAKSKEIADAWRRGDLKM